MCTLTLSDRSILLNLSFSSCRYILFSFFRRIDRVSSQRAQFHISFIFCARVHCFGSLLYVCVYVCITCSNSIYKVINSNTSTFTFSFKLLFCSLLCCMEDLNLLDVPFFFLIYILASDLVEMKKMLTEK